MYSRAGVVLSAAVMTHPSRMSSVLRLITAHPEIGFTVAADPAPGERGATLRTAQVAWRLADERATHHLVIQDDVSLPARFAESVSAAIAVMPGCALAFFAEWGARSSGMVRLAALRGSPWAEVVDHYVPTQALVLPVAAARGFDAYVRANATDDDPDDIVLLNYLHDIGMPAYVAVPNIVEHQDLPSLVGNDSQGRRRSTCYLPGASAPIWPSSHVLAGLPIVPYFSWLNAKAKCQVRDTAVAGGWRCEFAADVLSRYGLGNLPSQPAGLIRSCLGSLSWTREVTGSAVLGELWLAALTLGVAAAENPVTETAITPLARHALATLAPGGLRLLADDESVTRTQNQLTALVTDGVRTGLGLVAARLVQPFNPVLSPL